MSRLKFVLIFIMIGFVASVAFDFWRYPGRQLGVSYFSRDLTERNAGNQFARVLADKFPTGTNALTTLEAMRRLGFRCWRSERRESRRLNCVNERLVIVFLIKWIAEFDLDAEEKIIKSDGWVAVISF